MFTNRFKAPNLGSWQPKVLVSLISATLVFSGIGISPASATDPIPPDGSWQADAVAENATPAELKAEVADGELRMVVIRDDAGEPDATVITVDDAKSLEGTLKAINRDESVISVQVDQKVSLLGPTMTSFVSASPPTAPFVQWNYSALRLGEIHSSFTGTGITVAVIDSGVDRTAFELNSVGQVLDGCDWVTSSTNVCTGTGVNDENGHGTHVAGIIAAKSDGLGVTGVAPGVTILPLRVLDANGSGYLSDVAAAIDYAVLQNAKVINMSLGGTADFSLIRQAVTRAATAGVTVVAAAGNSGPDAVPSYPAAYPEVIAVAATTSDKIIATYSNGGSYVDVAAPGSAILSSWPTGTGYARLSGTSMAAPHVAGLAALLLQKNVLSAELSMPTAVKNQIETTALKDNVSGYGVTDYSLARYGAGFIDIYGALGCGGVGCTTPNTTPDPVEESSAPLDQTLPAVVEAAPAPVAAPAPAAPAPVAAAPVAAAPVAVAPVAAAPVAVEVIRISKVVKRKFTLRVASPKGSQTWIQRKSGKKWVTIKKVASKSKSKITVSSSGTYRIQIVEPPNKVTSSSFKVVTRKFTLTEDSPAGSKAWIQRKSGKKWVTIKKVASKSGSVIKVSKSGTYRIQIVEPSRKVTSSSFKVK
jgi:serine protease